ncbi:MAG: threonine synthase [Firmicutes bacterium]|nr:threonine synthase [Bacillota bacterium]MCM1401407.1 threonine synthase [Bacteroides sp.]MCM1477323.1 threonine synthase [Bacteroides sp.]
MRYYSTNGSGNSVNLCEAVTHCFAPDGGVYMPLSIPLIPKALFNNIAAMSMTDIGYVMGSTLFGSDIEPELINDIVKETLSFDIPLVQISDHTYALELYHGPTKTFKDVGARFMARIVDYFIKTGKVKTDTLNLLVATQGDTGYAVAEAFANMKGVNVFIFHPSENTLKLPEHMMHPVASNVKSVEVRGTLDDCQELVRRAYEDEELNSMMTLTSANSINIARLLPQTMFYFYAYARLKALGEKADRITVAMPCGNLGNLTAALFAKQMGLPISRIMAAGRGHARLWGEMSEGILAVNHFNQRALSTNLSRINTLMAHNASLAGLVDCHTYSPEEVDNQISLMYASNHYLMGRNTALACKSMMDNRRPDEVGVFLATDHPEFYSEKLNDLLGLNLSLAAKPKKIFRDRSPQLSPTLPAVKRFILDNIS